MTEIEQLRCELDNALTELQILRAVEDIKQLKYRYFRSMDTADMSLLRSVLAEDFTFDLSGSAWALSGRTADDFVAKMTLNFNSDMGTQHHGHHPEISIDPGLECANGVWYLQDIVNDTVANTLVFGTNFYDDRYVRTSQGWKIASSRWTRHIEVRHALPWSVQYNDRYLAKHGRKLAP